MIFQLFVTYHSYGQYILYPWGFDKDKNAPNWRKMHAMAEVAGKAMQDNSGHKYTIGAAAKVLYPAAGEGGSVLHTCFTVEAVFSKSNTTGLCKRVVPRLRELGTHGQRE